MCCCHILDIPWLFFGWHSASGIPYKVPWKATVLKRCTVTERFWNRNPVSRVSTEVFDSRQPSSVMRPSLFIGPRVSMMTWTKMYLLSSSAYFECFLVAAYSDAPPASTAVSATYEAATMWTIVASHIKEYPSLQWTRVWPSGVFHVLLLLLLLGAARVREISGQRQRGWEVPAKATALKCWIIKESLWNRKLVFRISSVCCVVWRPIIILIITFINNKLMKLINNNYISQ